MQISWQSANLFPLDAHVAIGDTRLIPVIETIRTDHCNIVFEISTL